MARSWLRHLGVVLALAALLLAPLAVPGLRPSDLLLRAWQSQLDELPAEQLPAQLRRIAHLGDRSIVVLVEALASPRLELSQPAGHVLRQRLEAWRQLPLEQSGPKVAQLAQQLADHCEQMSPWALQIASELAASILDWPTDHQGQEIALLINHCHYVMSTAGVPPAAPQVAESGEAGEEKLQSSAPQPPSHLPAPPADAMGLAERPPAAGSSTLRISDEPEEAATPDVRSPAGASAALSDDPPADRGQPTSRAPIGDILQEAPRLFTEASGAASTDPQAERGSPSGTSAAAVRGLYDVDLMRLLHDHNEALAKSASRELLERGYSEVQLQLAQQLFDPDPSVRRRLVQRLMRLSTGDARPWLLTLSRDPSVEVREAAATAMATSNDPQLHARLRELELEETDPDLLEQVRRITTQRR